MTNIIELFVPKFMELDILVCMSVDFWFKSYFQSGGHFENKPIKRFHLKTNWNPNIAYCYGLSCIQI